MQVFLQKSLLFCTKNCRKILLFQKKVLSLQSENNNNNYGKHDYRSTNTRYGPF